MTSIMQAALEEKSFRRKALISNHDRYRPSMEMRVFMAENPDYTKDGLKQDFQAGYNMYDPAFAKTNDTDSLMGLGFPYNYYATENISKPIQRHPRFSRNLEDNRSYDDFNDRAEKDVVAHPYPVVGAKSAIKKERAVTSRPAGSSLLANAGSMQINEYAQVPRNPIAGFSEGEAQHQVFQSQYKNYARRELQSSQSGSPQRSKSARARLEARIKDDEQYQVESMATLMRQTKNHAHPNEFALKQRFLYSKGTLHKTSSHDAFKDLVDPEGHSNSKQHHISQIISQKPAGQGQSPSIFLRRVQEPTGKIGSIEQKYAFVKNDNRTGLAGFTHAGGSGFAVAQVSGAGAPSSAHMPYRDTKSPTRIVLAENAQHRQELQTKEHQKMEYKQFLMDQIAQKEEQKRISIQKRKEEDEKWMQEFEQFRFGAKNQGGGSPIRDHRGDIITQHVPFASQLQNEGAVNYQQQRLMSGKDVNRGHFDLGQSFNAFQIQDLHNQSFAKKSFSPNRNEIAHMRPSNNFENITEDEFNKREQSKKMYQNELFAQMNEARAKKEAERQRRMQEDVVEEQKIKEQLKQIGEEFNRKDGKTPLKQQPGLMGVEAVRSRLRTDPVQDYHERQHSSQSSLNIRKVDRSHSRDEHHINIAPTAGYDYEGFNEQMEKLRRMQDDIDRRNEEERRDTNNIINEIMNQQRIMMLGGKVRSFETFAGHSELHNVTEIAPIKHESLFQPLKFSQNQISSQPMSEFMGDVQATGNMVEASSYIDNGDYAKKDDLGKLDDIISSFNQLE